VLVIDGVGVADETPREKDCVEVVPPVSVTCAVKANDPVCDVVPLNLPVLPKVNPCGSEPPAMAHW
jgi:hypothetical protein